MTVAELIKILQAQPQDVLVVYSYFSEYALMSPEQIRVGTLGKPRQDGWVHDVRQDKPTQQYILFP